METPGNEPFNELPNQIKIFEDQNEKVQPLNKEKFNSLPLFKYKGKKGKTCLICSVDFKNGDLIGILPCLH